MKKLMTGVTAAVLTSVSLGQGVVSAGAAPAIEAVVASAQDVQFLQGNARTDLAEITIGKLALLKAQHADTKMMAKGTISDHTKALAKLKAVAKTLDVALPSSPGTVQKAAAAKLMAVPAAQFDKTYDNIQITGHVESIAHTKTEIVVGKDAAVIAFAKYYLPVAEKHLRMARADLAALS
jgi:putative membrane protein